MKKYSEDEKWMFEAFRQAEKAYNDELKLVTLNVSPANLGKGLWLSQFS